MTTTKPFILIADTDPMWLDLGNTFLSRMGLNVEIVGTSVDAVRKLKQRISIFILNPELLSGEEQRKLAILWRADRFKSIPLILLKPDKLLVNDELLSHGQKVILKPMALDKLGVELSPCLNMALRKHPRLAVDFPVEAEWERPFHARSLDISADGLQIATEEVIPSRSNIYLSFLIREMRHIIRCAGKIIWTFPKAANGEHRYGVKLQYLNPRIREVLSDFVEERLANQLISIDTR